MMLLWLFSCHDLARNKIMTVVLLYYLKATCINQTSVREINKVFLKQLLTPDRLNPHRAAVNTCAWTEQYVYVWIFVSALSGLPVCAVHVPLLKSPNSSTPSAAKIKKRSMKRRPRFPTCREKTGRERDQLEERNPWQNILITRDNKYLIPLRKQIEGRDEAARRKCKLWQSAIH